MDVGQNNKILGVWTKQLVLTLNQENSHEVVPKKCWGRLRMCLSDCEISNFLKMKKKIKSHNFYILLIKFQMFSLILVQTKFKIRIATRAFLILLTSQIFCSLEKL